MEILRKDWSEFQEFSQVYFTTAYPRVMKAWHIHKIQWDNITCVKGSNKTAFFINVPTELFNYETPDEYSLPPDTDWTPYDRKFNPYLRHG